MMCEKTGKATAFYSSKITQQHFGVLRLIDRSKCDLDGWCECSPIVGKAILKCELPPSLVDTQQDSGAIRVRLTIEARVLLKWF